MPAKSEAQRRYLNWKFGHSWVKEHGFDTKGKLPARVPKALPKAKGKAKGKARPKPRPSTAPRGSPRKRGKR